MRKFSKYLLLVVSLFIVVISGIERDQSVCFADEGRQGILQGVEFLTGFAVASLDSKPDYHVIPFFVDFDFDLKPLARRAGINPWGFLQFQLEPFLSLVARPDTNIETGGSFFIKLGLLPESMDSKLKPYAKVGWGVAYMTQHTHEQSTQYNFLSHVGAGVHYSLTRNTALTVEYRFRHLSNASIKSPNSGIDAHFALAGISYQF